MEGERLINHTVQPFSIKNKVPNAQKQYCVDRLTDTEAKKYKSIIFKFQTNWERPFQCKIKQLQC